MSVRAHADFLMALLKALNKLNCFFLIIFIKISYIFTNEPYRDKANNLVSDQV